MMSERSIPKSPFPRAWRVCGDDRGSELVEFAFVLVVFLTFLLGIMEFSRLLYTYHFVSEVAREGTRYASVRGSTFGTKACAQTPYVTFGCSAVAGDVQSYVQNQAPLGIASSSVNVTTTWPGTAPNSGVAPCPATGGTNGLRNVPGCDVQVVVTYGYKFIFPFLPTGASTWNLSSTAEMVIQQ